ncbi:MAG: flagellar filament capping protein FliD [Phycisphaerae bacterium]|nr:flagellar filament capping protein FliD [Phycisphaerae bacterium]
MAELRLSGLNSGIDTGKIIEQLMEVNRRRLRMMEAEIQRFEQRRSAVSELQGKLNTLRSTAGELSDSSQLRSYNVTTSDPDSVTADVGSSALEGNHSVQIKQLATSDRWVHSGLAYATSYVGAGNFIISYNNKELAVQTSTETTLNDLVGLINNDQDNPGVTASILKYDNGTGGVYHLVLGGKDSGSDYQISINPSNTEVHAADSELKDTNDANAVLTTKLTGLSTFSGDMESGTTLDRIRITGADHDNNSIDIYFNVTRYTTLEDVIGHINNAYDGSAVATLSEGVIKLTDTTCGASHMNMALTFVAGTDSTAELTLPTIVQSVIGGSTTAGIAGFDASSFTETQSAQDSKVRVDGYPQAQTVAEVQLFTSSVNATAGTYTLTLNGQTTAALNYNDDVATVQNALNGLSSIQAIGGVTVGGTPPSESGAMTFTFLETAGNVDRIIVNSSLSPGTHVTSTQTQGRDGWINRSTNTVDDVLTGVTLKLHRTTGDGAGGYNSIQVNLTRDTETLKAKIEEMITAYNTAVMFIQEKTRYDAETSTSGILANDYSVSTVWNQIKQGWSQAARGFGGDDSFSRPGDIGITLGSDGMLKLDSNVFNAAIVENYMGVLSLVGALKTGVSNSNVIKFSGASKYTKAGQFEVQVFGDGAQITSARIREVGGEWRDATWVDNIVYGDSTFDKSYPVHPENGLQFTVDLSKTASNPTAIITVKHGFAGSLKETLDSLLDRTTGRVPISINSIDAQIRNANGRIDKEETRLEIAEKRLVEKFSRLEKTLSLIQQQMGALSMLR